MQPLLTERDLDELPEPIRSKAFEFLCLLRESGYSEQLALRLALRGAQEAEGTPRDRFRAERPAATYPQILDANDRASEL